MAKMDLRGKNALVTGASTGIGRELAACLAREGANLVLAALPAEQPLLEQVAAGLETAHGIKTWTMPVDLARGQGPAELHGFAMDSAGRIDVLVNNAGVLHYGDFHAIDPAKHDLLLSVNVRAYLLLMRLFLPEMVERGSGRVLNVASAAAFAPTANHAAYGASKAFVQSLSEAVRAEIRGSGVRITTLNPGYVDTGLLKKEGFPDRVRFFSLGGLADAASVAAKGVAAMQKGKSLCMPGVINRLSCASMSRILPRSANGVLTSFLLGARGR